MIGWSPRQIKKTRSSPSTATPATSRCSNPFGSCSQPSTTSYLMVGLLRDSTPGALHAPARSYTVAALREAFHASRPDLATPSAPRDEDAHDVAGGRRTAPRRRRAGAGGRPAGGHAGRRPRGRAGEPRSRAG